MSAPHHPPIARASVLRPVERHPERHWLRRVVYAVVALLLLAGLALVGVGWYFSAQVLDVGYKPDAYSLRVLALGNGTVELPRTDDSMRLGRFGLEWHGGRALLGGIVGVPIEGRDGVVRRISGNTRGLTVGTLVRMNPRMYDSAAQLHLAYRTVDVPDPLGPMPAWYFPGRRSTWVVLAHGYKETRTEGLRAVPTLVSLGMPVLDVSYRNDPGAPPSPDHLYHLGASEWEDVQAGVQYAFAHGAHDVILYGYSMGGGTVEYFLHHSHYAGRVRAVVLDSPALDWSAMLDLQASDRHLPGIVTRVAERIIAYRIGLPSLEPLNAVDKTASLRAPTLLFAAGADKRVPLRLNVAFARSRPGLVTYVFVRGAAHTLDWNVDPARYQSRLGAFLRTVLR